MPTIPIHVVHAPDVILVSARLPDADPGSLRVDVTSHELAVHARAGIGISDGEPLSFTYPIPVPVDTSRSMMRFERGLLVVSLAKRTACVPRAAVA